MKASMNKRYGWAILAVMAVAIAGCGGGGSGTPAPTFPLRSALDVMTLKGSTFTMTAIGTGAPATKATDGDCSGTLTETDQHAVTSTVFDGSPGYSSDISATLTFTLGCGQATVTATETDYFDSNLLPVGAEVTGLNYFGKYLTPPVIPAIVKQGDKGDIGRLTFYSEKAYTTRVRYADRSYVIEADSPASDTTAIANSISKAYSDQGALITNSEVRYRIDTAGKLTLVSQKIWKYDNSTNPPAETLVVFRCTSGC
jgi:hypothetical protein